MKEINKILSQKNYMETEDTIALLSSKNVKDVTLEYIGPRSHPSAGKNTGKGFIQILDCLVCYPQLKLNDRLVYSAIRNYAYDPRYNKKTTVTNETIARRLGISKSSVSSSISKLQSLGIIRLHMNSSHVRVIKVVSDFYEEQPEEKAWREKLEEEMKARKESQDADTDLDEDDDMEDFPF